MDLEKQGEKINLIYRATCRNRRELVTEILSIPCSGLTVVLCGYLVQFLKVFRVSAHHPIAQTVVGLYCRDVTLRISVQHMERPDVQSKQSQEQMPHLRNPGQKKILKVKEDEFAYKGEEGKNRAILKSVRSNFKL